MHYLLCGFSGAGKTHTLYQIQKMGKYPDYTFIDLDEYFEEKMQMKISSFIEKESVESFRSKEQILLRELIEGNANLWLSLGGGSLSHEALSFLETQGAKVFWIQREFEFCWSNIKDDPNRFLAKNGKDEMKKIFDQREEIFKKFPLFIAQDHFCG